jgi:hypothetical protein
MGSVDDPVFDFYERLAPDYHLLFSDWKASVLRQGQTLDALIRAEVGPGPSSILDCTCGIGTRRSGSRLRARRPAHLSRARSGAPDGSGRSPCCVRGGCPASR